MSVYVNGDPVNLVDPTGHSYTTGCEDDPNCSGPSATGGGNSTSCDTCHTYPTQYTTPTAHGRTCDASCQQEAHRERAQAVANDRARQAAPEVKPGFQEGPQEAPQTVPAPEDIRACASEIPQTAQIIRQFRPLSSAEQSGLTETLSGYASCGGGAIWYALGALNTAWGANGRPLSGPPGSYATGFEAAVNEEVGQAELSAVMSSSETRLPLDRTRRSSGQTSRGQRPLPGPPRMRFDT